MRGCGRPRFLVRQGRNVFEGRRRAATRSSGYHRRNASGYDRPARSGTFARSGYFSRKAAFAGRIPIVAWHGVRASQVSVARFREAAELGITVNYTRFSDTETACKALEYAGRPA